MSGYWCPRCGKWCKHSSKCPCREKAKRKPRGKIPLPYQKYGYQWEKLSKQYRKDNPLCERCLAMGRTRPATECHHRRKVRDFPHLKYDVRNIIALCRPCHVIMERGTG